MELSTDQLELADRRAYWRDTLSRSFVPIDLLADDSSTFTGSVRARLLGNLSVAELSGSEQVLRRPPRLISSTDQRLLHVVVGRRGSASVGQDGRSTSLGPGDVIVYETCRPFEARFFDDWSAILLTMPRDSLPYSSERTAQVTARRLSTNSDLAAVIARSVTDAATHFESVPPALAPRLITDLIELTVALIEAESEREVRYIDLAPFPGTATPTTRRESLLHTIKEYIEENLTDQGLTPSVVACANHISVRYLHRLFREEEETSVSDFVRLRRLYRCAADLRDDELREVPVSVIARRAGFHDVSGFGRAFRSTFGRTPTAYRDSHSG